MLNVILILQVIFLALDALVKNVVSTYSLEHKSIDDLFDSIFNCLDVLDKEGKDNYKTFQGLLFCIGTIQTTIYQHMLKEEEQVCVVSVICIDLHQISPIFVFKLRYVLDANTKRSI